LTFDNFSRAWSAAPFARYFLNTFALVTLILGCQLILCTLAAYAFARADFAGSGIAFALVLAQLMIMPDVLIVENYRIVSTLGVLDTIPAIALPYMASAFGIFLLRQTFKGVPNELVDAARVEGASAMQILWRVFVPLGRSTYLAFALVSVSYHWNNFLWPLIVTNSVQTPDRRTGGVRGAGNGRRLVGHQRGHGHDHAAAPRGVLAVPAAVRSIVHACRHSVMH
jgi:sn-glycerol 3-phosphate transport system permease protein